MNVGNILNSAKTAVTSKAGRSLLHVQKHSPILLFAAGGVGAVTSTVLACKATLRLEETTSDHNDKLADIESAVEKGETPSGRPYSSADGRRDAAVVRVRKTVDVCKLYGPAILVGGLSVAALTGSHVILSKRNTGLMAAYAALDAGFRDYRGRVANRVGVEEERDLYLNAEDREGVDDDGTAVIKKVAEVAPGTFYARVFDKSVAPHQDRNEHNEFFLRGVQSYANDMLNSRGHLFLNELYRDLGLSHTKAGAMVGWVKGNREGQGFIDIGINNGLVFNGDGGIVLDFNVDGVILDLI